MFMIAPSIIPLRISDDAVCFEENGSQYSLSRTTRQTIFSHRLHAQTECMSANAMHKRQPSLDLLRGFEAAARHLSFTKAARELYVTQSAVSRQVKALEQQLEVQLFKRRHRELVLTEAGRMLYETTGEVLRMLADAASRMRAGPKRLLTVTTTIAFASLWLVPRLAEFRRLHADIDVRIAAENEISDLERDGIDLAIRYCQPNMIRGDAVRLFGERVFPVCAANVARTGSLRSPRDLSRHVLLHLDDPKRRYPWLMWDVWLEPFKAQGLRPAGDLRFSHYDHMMQAAIAGQGIALGRSPLIDRWMKEKRLVSPFGTRFVSPAAQSRAYFLLTAPTAAGRSEVAQFSRWLKLEAART
jgi:DNA-binding transcriptional LysR family regulator